MKSKTKKIISLINLISLLVNLVAPIFMYAKPVYAVDVDGWDGGSAAVIDDHTPPKVTETSPTPVSTPIGTKPKASCGGEAGDVASDQVATGAVTGAATDGRWKCNDGKWEPCPGCEVTYGPQYVLERENKDIGFTQAAPVVECKTPDGKECFEGNPKLMLNANGEILVMVTYPDWMACPGGSAGVDIGKYKGCWVDQNISRDQIPFHPSEWDLIQKSKEVQQQVNVDIAKQVCAQNGISDPDCKERLADLPQGGEAEVKKYISDSRIINQAVKTCEVHGEDSVECEKAVINLRGTGGGAKEVFQRVERNIIVNAAVDACKDGRQTTSCVIALQKLDTNTQNSVLQFIGDQKKASLFNECAAVDRQECIDILKSSGLSADDQKKLLNDISSAQAQQRIAQGQFLAALGDQTECMKYAGGSPDTKDYQCSQQRNLDILKTTDSKAYQQAVNYNLLQSIYTHDRTALGNDCANRLKGEQLRMCTNLDAYADYLVTKNIINFSVVSELYGSNATVLKNNAVAAVNNYGNPATSQAFGPQYQNYVQQCAGSGAIYDPRASVCIGEKQANGYPTIIAIGIQPKCMIATWELDGGKCVPPTGVNPIQGRGPDPTVARCPEGYEKASDGSCYNKDPLKDIAGTWGNCSEGYRVSLNLFSRTCVPDTLDNNIAFDLGPLTIKNADDTPLLQRVLFGGLFTAEGLQDNFSTDRGTTIATLSLKPHEIGEGISAKIEENTNKRCQDYVNSGVTIPTEFNGNSNDPRNSCINYNPPTDNHGDGFYFEYDEQVRKNSIAEAAITLYGDNADQYLDENYNLRPDVDAKTKAELEQLAIEIVDVRIANKPIIGSGLLTAEQYATDFSWIEAYRDANGQSGSVINPYLGNQIYVDSDDDGKKDSWIDTGEAFGEIFQQVDPVWGNILTIGGLCNDCGFNFMRWADNSLAPNSASYEYEQLTGDGANSIVSVMSTAGVYVDTKTTTYQDFINDEDYGAINQVVFEAASQSILEFNEEASEDTVSGVIHRAGQPIQNALAVGVGIASGAIASLVSSPAGGVVVSVAAQTAVDAGMQLILNAVTETQQERLVTHLEEASANTTDQNQSEALSQYATIAQNNEIKRQNTEFMYLLAGDLILGGIGETVGAVMKAGSFMPKIADNIIFSATKGSTYSVIDNGITALEREMYEEIATNGKLIRQFSALDDAGNVIKITHPSQLTLPGIKVVKEITPEAVKYADDVVKSIDSGTLDSRMKKFITNNGGFQEDRIVAEVIESMRQNGDNAAIEAFSQTKIVREILEEASLNPAQKLIKRTTNTLSQAQENVKKTFGGTQTTSTVDLNKSSAIGVSFTVGAGDEVVDTTGKKVILGATDSSAKYARIIDSEGRIKFAGQINENTKITLSQGDRIQYAKEPFRGSGASIGYQIKSENLLKEFNVVSSLELRKNPIKIEYPGPLARLFPSIDPNSPKKIFIDGKWVELDSLSVVKVEGTSNESIGRIFTTLENNKRGLVIVSGIGPDGAMQLKKVSFAGRIANADKSFLRLGRGINPATGRFNIRVWGQNRIADVIPQNSLIGSTLFIKTTKNTDLGTLLRTGENGNNPITFELVGRDGEITDSLLEFDPTIESLDDFINKRLALQVGNPSGEIIGFQYVDGNGIIRKIVKTTNGQFSESISFGSRLSSLVSKSKESISIRIETMRYGEIVDQADDVVLSSNKTTKLSIGNRTITIPKEGGFIRIIDENNEVVYAKALGIDSSIRGDFLQPGYKVQVSMGRYNKGVGKTINSDSLLSQFIEITDGTRLKQPLTFSDRITSIFRINEPKAKPFKNLSNYMNQIGETDASARINAGKLTNTGDYEDSLRRITRINKNFKPASTDMYRLTVPEGATPELRSEISQFNNLIERFEAQMGYHLRQEQVSLLVAPENILQLQAGGGKTSVIGPLIASSDRLSIFTMANSTEATSFTNDIVKQIDFYNKEGITPVFYDNKRGFLEISGTFDRNTAKIIDPSKLRQLAQEAAANPQKHGLMIITESSDNAWAIVSAKNTPDSGAASLLYDLEMGGEYTLVVDELGSVVNGHFSISQGDPTRIIDLTDPKQLLGLSDGSEMIRLSNEVKDSVSTTNFRNQVLAKIKNGEGVQGLFAKRGNTIQPWPSDVTIHSNSYADIIEQTLKDQSLTAALQKNPNLRQQLENLSSSLRSDPGNLSTHAELENILKSVGEDGSDEMLANLAYRKADLQARWSQWSRVPENDFGQEGSELVLRKMGGTTGEQYSQVVQKIALQQEGPEMLIRAGSKVDQNALGGVENLSITPDSHQISNLELYQEFKKNGGKFRGYDATPDTAANAMGAKATAFSEPPAKPKNVYQSNNMEELIRTNANNPDYLKSIQGKTPGFVVADDGISFQKTTAMLLDNHTKTTKLARTKFITEPNGAIKTEYYMEEVVRSADGKVTNRIQTAFNTEKEWGDAIQKELAGNPEKLMIVYEGRTRAVDLSVTTNNKKISWNTIANDTSNNMEDITQSWKRNRIPAKKDELLASGQWSQAEIAEASQYNLWLRSEQTDLNPGNVVGRYQEILDEQLANTRLQNTLNSFGSAQEKAITSARQKLISGISPASKRNKISNRLDGMLEDARRIKRAQAMEISRNPLNADDISTEVYIRGQQAHQRLEHTLEGMQKEFNLSKAQVDEIKKTWGIDKPYLSRVEFDRVFNSAVPARQTIETPVNPSQTAFTWAETNVPRTPKFASSRNKVPEFAFHQKTSEPVLHAPTKNSTPPSSVNLATLTDDIKTNNSVAFLRGTAGQNATASRLQVFLSRIPFTKAYILHRSLTQSLSAANQGRLENYLQSSQLNEQMDGVGYSDYIKGSILNALTDMNNRIIQARVITTANLARSGNAQTDNNIQFLKDSNEDVSFIKETDGQGSKLNGKEIEKDKIYAVELGDVLLLASGIAFVVALNEDEKISLVPQDSKKPIAEINTSDTETSNNTQQSADPSDQIRTESLESTTMGRIGIAAYNLISGNKFLTVFTSLSFIDANQKIFNDIIEVQDNAKWPNVSLSISGNKIIVAPTRSPVFLQRMADRLSNRSEFDPSDILENMQISTSDKRITIQGFNTARRSQVLVEVQENLGLVGAKNIEVVQLNYSVNGIKQASAFSLRNGKLVPVNLWKESVAESFGYKVTPLIEGETVELWNEGGRLGEIFRVSNAQHESVFVNLPDQGLVELELEKSQYLVIRSSDGKSSEIRNPEILGFKVNEPTDANDLANLSNQIDRSSSKKSNSLTSQLASSINPQTMIPTGLGEILGIIYLGKAYINSWFLKSTEMSIEKLSQKINSLKLNKKPNFFESFFLRGLQCSVCTVNLGRVISSFLPGTQANKNYRLINDLLSSAAQGGIASEVDLIMELGKADISHEQATILSENIIQLNQSAIEYLSKQAQAIPTEESQIKNENLPLEERITQIIRESQEVRIVDGNGVIIFIEKTANFEASSVKINQILKLIAAGNTLQWTNSTFKLKLGQRLSDQDQKYYQNKGRSLALNKAVKVQQVYIEDLNYLSNDGTSLHESFYAEIIDFKGSSAEDILVESEKKISILANIISTSKTKLNKNVVNEINELLKQLETTQEITQIISRMQIQIIFSDYENLTERMQALIKENGELLIKAKELAKNLEQSLRGKMNIIIEDASAANAILTNNSDIVLSISTTQAALESSLETNLLLIQKITLEGSTEAGINIKPLRDSLAKIRAQIDKIDSASVSEETLKFLEDQYITNEEEILDIEQSLKEVSEVKKLIKEVEEIAKEIPSGNQQVISKIITNIATIRSYEFLPNELAREVDRILEEIIQEIANTTSKTVVEINSSIEKIASQIRLKNSEEAKKEILGKVIQRERIGRNSGDISRYDEPLKLISIFLEQMWRLVKNRPRTLLIFIRNIIIDIYQYTKAEFKPIEPNFIRAENLFIDDKNEVKSEIELQMKDYKSLSFFRRIISYIFDSTFNPHITIENQAFVIVAKAYGEIAQVNENLDEMQNTRKGLERTKRRLIKAQRLFERQINQIKNLEGKTAKLRKEEDRTILNTKLEQASEELDNAINKIKESVKAIEARELALTSSAEVQNLFLTIDEAYTLINKNSNRDFISPNNKEIAKNNSEAKALLEKLKVAIDSQAINNAINPSNEHIVNQLQNRLIDIINNLEAIEAFSVQSQSSFLGIIKTGTLAVQNEQLANSYIQEISVASVNSIEIKPNNNHLLPLQSIEVNRGIIIESFDPETEKIILQNGDVVSFINEVDQVVTLRIVVNNNGELVGIIAENSKTISQKVSTNLKSSSRKTQAKVIGLLLSRVEQFVTNNQPTIEQDLLSYKDPHSQPAYINKKALKTFQNHVQTIDRQLSQLEWAKSNSQKIQANLTKIDTLEKQLRLLKAKVTYQVDVISNLLAEQKGTLKDGGIKEKIILTDQNEISNGIPGLDIGESGRITIRSSNNYAVFINGEVVSKTTILNPQKEYVLSIKNNETGEVRSFVVSSDGEKIEYQEVALSPWLRNLKENSSGLSIINARIRSLKNFDVAKIYGADSIKTIQDVINGDIAVLSEEVGAPLVFLDQKIPGPFNLYKLKEGITSSVKQVKLSISQLESLKYFKGEDQRINSQIEDLKLKEQTLQAGLEIVDRKISNLGPIEKQNAVSQKITTGPAYYFAGIFRNVFKTMMWLIIPVYMRYSLGFDTFPDVYTILNNFSNTFSDPAVFDSIQAFFTAVKNSTVEISTFFINFEASTILGNFLVIYPLQKAISGLSKIIDNLWNYYLITGGYFQIFDLEFYINGLLGTFSAVFDWQPDLLKTKLEIKGAKEDGYAIELNGKIRGFAPAGQARILYERSAWYTSWIVKRALGIQRKSIWTIIGKPMHYIKAVIRHNLVFYKNNLLSIGQTIFEGNLDNAPIAIQNTLKDPNFVLELQKIREELARASTASELKTMLHYAASAITHGKDFVREINEVVRSTYEIKFSYGEVADDLSVQEVMDFLALLQEELELLSNQVNISSQALIARDTVNQAIGIKETVQIAEKKSIVERAISGMTRIGDGILHLGTNLVIAVTSPIILPGILTVNAIDNSFKTNKITANSKFLSYLEIISAKANEATKNHTGLRAVRNLLKLTSFDNQNVFDRINQNKAEYKGIFDIINDIGTIVEWLKDSPAYLKQFWQIIQDNNYSPTKTINDLIKLLEETRNQNQDCSLLSSLTIVEQAYASVGKVDESCPVSRIATDTLDDIEKTSPNTTNFLNNITSILYLLQKIAGIQKVQVVNTVEVNQVSMIEAKSMADLENDQKVITQALANERKSQEKELSIFEIANRWKTNSRVVGEALERAKKLGEADVQFSSKRIIWYEKIRTGIARIALTASMTFLSDTEVEDFWRTYVDRPVVKVKLENGDIVLAPKLYRGVGDETLLAEASSWFLSTSVNTSLKGKELTAKVIGATANLLALNALTEQKYHLKSKYTFMIENEAGADLYQIDLYQNNKIKTTSQLEEEVKSLIENPGLRVNQIVLGEMKQIGDRGGHRVGDLITNNDIQNANSQQLALINQLDDIFSNQIVENDQRVLPDNDSSINTYGTLARTHTRIEEIVGENKTINLHVKHAHTWIDGYEAEANLNLIVADIDEESGLEKFGKITQPPIGELKLPQENDKAIEITIPTTDFEVLIKQLKELSGNKKNSIPNIDTLIFASIMKKMQISNGITLELVNGESGVEYSNIAARPIIANLNPKAIEVMNIEKDATKQGHGYVSTMAVATDKGWVRNLINNVFGWSWPEKTYALAYAMYSRTGASGQPDFATAAGNTQTKGIVIGAKKQGTQMKLVLRIGPEASQEVVNNFNNIIRDYNQLGAYLISQMNQEMINSLDEEMLINQLLASANSKSGYMVTSINDDINNRVGKTREGIIAHVMERLATTLTAFNYPEVATLIDGQIRRGGGVKTAIKYKSIIDERLAKIAPHKSIVEKHVDQILENTFQSIDNQTNNGSTTISLNNVPYGSITLVPATSMTQNMSTTTSDLSSVELELRSIISNSTASIISLKNLAVAQISQIWRPIGDESNFPFESMHQEDSRSQLYEILVKPGKVMQKFAGDKWVPYTEGEVVEGEIYVRLDENSDIFQIQTIVDDEGRYDLIVYQYKRTNKLEANQSFQLSEPILNLDGQAINLSSTSQAVEAVEGYAATTTDPNGCTDCSLFVRKIKQLIEKATNSNTKADDAVAALNEAKELVLDHAFGNVVIQSSTQAITEAAEGLSKAKLAKLDRSELAGEETFGEYGKLTTSSPEQLERAIKELEEAKDLLTKAIQTAETGNLIPDLEAGVMSRKKLVRELTNVRAKINRIIYNTKHTLGFAEDWQPGKLWEVDKNAKYLALNIADEIIITNAAGEIYDVLDLAEMSREEFNEAMETAEPYLEEDYRMYAFVGKSGAKTGDVISPDHQIITNESPEASLLSKTFRTLVPTFSYSFREDPFRFLFRKDIFSVLYIGIVGSLLSNLILDPSVSVVTKVALPALYAYFYFRDRELIHPKLLDPYAQEDALVGYLIENVKPGIQTRPGVAWNNFKLSWYKWGLIIEPKTIFITLNDDEPIASLKVSDHEAFIRQVDELIDNARFIRVVGPDNTIQFTASYYDLITDADARNALILLAAGGNEVQWTKNTFKLGEGEQVSANNRAYYQESGKSFQLSEPILNLDDQAIDLSSTSQDVDVVEGDAAMTAIEPTVAVSMTAFDGEQELQKILKQPKNQRRQLLSEFKLRLAKQMTDLASMEEAIIDAIMINPKLSKKEINKIITQFTSTTEINQKQIDATWKLWKVFVKVRSRANAIKAQYPDQRELFKASFGFYPKGQIELVNSPIIYFRIWKGSTFRLAKISNPKQKIDLFMRITSGINILDEDVGFFDPEDNRFHGAELGQYYNEDENGLSVTYIHEFRHMVNKLLKSVYLFGGSDEYISVDKILSDYDEKVENASFDDLAAKIDGREIVESVRPSERFLTPTLISLRDYANSNMSDEILAQYVDGDNSSKQIIHSLNNKVDYDFYSQVSLRFQNRYPARDESFIKTSSEIINTIFSDEARENLIRQAVGALDSLVGSGLSRKQAVAILSKVPLSQWTKITNRLTGQDISSDTSASDAVTAVESYAGETADPNGCTDCSLFVRKIKQLIEIITHPDTPISEIRAAISQAQQLVGDHEMKNIVIQSSTSGITEAVEGLTEAEIADLSLEDIKNNPKLFGKYGNLTASTKEQRQRAISELEEAITLLKQAIENAKIGNEIPDDLIGIESRQELILDLESLLAEVRQAFFAQQYFHNHEQVTVEIEDMKEKVNITKISLGKEATDQPERVLIFSPGYGGYINSYGGLAKSLSEVGYGYYSEIWIAQTERIPNLVDSQNEIKAPFETEADLILAAIAKKATNEDKIKPLITGGENVDITIAGYSAGANISTTLAGKIKINNPSFTVKQIMFSVTGIIDFADNPIQFLLRNILQEVIQIAASLVGINVKKAELPPAPNQSFIAKATRQLTMVKNIVVRVNPWFTFVELMFNKTPIWFKELMQIYSHNPYIQTPGVIRVIVNPANDIMFPISSLSLANLDIPKNISLKERDRYIIARNANIPVSQVGIVGETGNFLANHIYPEENPDAIVSQAIALMKTAQPGGKESPEIAVDLSRNMSVKTSALELITLATSEFFANLFFKLPHPIIKPLANWGVETLSRQITNLMNSIKPAIR